ncbi:hypothetical protein INP51_08200 [Blautia liquoris]|uniref:Uncharacterized protein n=1 Tax=Blautia liquoris TaxID=2779518 RepID=A0A7M2RCI1_9FIRM|nr:hypothetical protein [Blautia liquoris]QOV18039.1 hypothetical protein INP51_08200 [Blautia liquoris]
MKKYKYSLEPDIKSKKGWESIVAAGISLALLLAGAVISLVMKGNGGTFLGAMGLFSFLLSAYGFYLGIQSFSEKNVNHRYSTIGSMASGILAVLWLALFLTGIS